MKHSNEITNSMSFFNFKNYILYYLNETTDHPDSKIELNYIHNDANNKKYAFELFLTNFNEFDFGNRSAAEFIYVDSNDIESLISDRLDLYSEIVDLDMIIFFINIESLSTSKKYHIIKNLTDNFEPKFKIRIIDLSEFRKIFKLRQLKTRGEDYNNLNISKNSKLYEDAYFAKLNLNNSNTTNMLKFKDIAANQRITLFLGAGISKDYKLPMWTDLLNLLSLDNINQYFNFQNPQKSLLQSYALTLLDSNPLIGASYLETGHNLSYKSKSDFNNLIHNCLYSSKSTPNSPSTIEVIVDKLSNYKNKGIRKMVTYNYDDLIEQEIKKSNPSINYTAIYNETSLDGESIPINHVHGFLPERSQSHLGYRRQDQELVFTEESYHQLQSDPYSWRNLTQINAFKNDNVLIVGMSLDDINLRKLLYLTSKYGNKTHTILLKNPKINLAKKDTNLSSDIDKILEFHKKIMTINLLKLGVKVIWYEDHTELPHILNSLL